MRGWPAGLPRLRREGVFCSGFVVSGVGASSAESNLSLASRSPSSRPSSLPSKRQGHELSRQTLSRQRDQAVSGRVCAAFRPKPGGLSGTSMTRSGHFPVRINSARSSSVKPRGPTGVFMESSVLVGSFTGESGGGGTRTDEGTFCARMAVRPPQADLIIARHGGAPILSDAPPQGATPTRSGRPSVPHPACALIDAEHPLACVAQALVEEIDVIAALGEQRDETAADIVEREGLVLRRVGLADLRADAGRKPVPAVERRVRA